MASQSTRQFLIPSSIKSKFHHLQPLVLLTIKSVSDTRIMIGYPCRTGANLELQNDQNLTSLLSLSPLSE